MPPLPRRLFVSIKTVERMAKTKQRRIVPPGETHMLGITLDTARLYSVLYVKELVNSKRVLSEDSVRRFNESTKGQRVIKAAKREFETQLRAYNNPYSDPDHPCLVTPRLLATTFLTEQGAIKSLCLKGVLPHLVIDQKYYFDPTLLLQHFEWSL